MTVGFRGAAENRQTHQCVSMSSMSWVKMGQEKPKEFDPDPRRDSEKKQNTRISKRKDLELLTFAFLL